MSHKDGTGDEGQANPKKDGTPHIIRLVKQLTKSNTLSHISGNAVKIVLAVLTREDDLFYRRKVALFNEELEAMTGLSKRTMMQAREDAVEAGVLTYVPGSKSIRGIYSTLIPEKVQPANVPKSPNLFSDEDRELEPVELAPVSVAEIDTESGICVAEIDTESSVCVAEIDTESSVCVAEIDTESSVCMAEIDTLINPNTLNPSPNPSPALSCIPTQNWGEVELKLLKLGLNAAAATVGEAQRRGYSPSLVSAIASHFERHPGAWHSPGVIRNAVVNHPASLAADAAERWPALAQEFSSRQRQARQIDRDEIERAKREAHAANVHRDQEDRHQREALFGGTLDAMTESELDALIDHASDATAIKSYLKLFGRTSVTVRSRLLRMLDERYATSQAGNQARPTEEPDCESDSPATILFPRAS